MNFSKLDFRQHFKQNGPMKIKKAKLYFRIKSRYFIAIVLETWANYFGSLKL
jgi:hypothetical protein